MPVAAGRARSEVAAQVRGRLLGTLQREQAAVDGVAVHGFSCFSGGDKRRAILRTLNTRQRAVSSVSSRMLAIWRNYSPSLTCSRKRRAKLVRQPGHGLGQQLPFLVLDSLFSRSSPLAARLSGRFSRWPVAARRWLMKLLWAMRNSQARKLELARNFPNPANALSNVSCVRSSAAWRSWLDGRASGTVDHSTIPPAGQRPDGRPVGRCGPAGTPRRGVCRSQRERSARPSLAGRRESSPDACSSYRPSVLSASASLHTMRRPAVRSAPLRENTLVGQAAGLPFPGRPAACPTRDYCLFVGRSSALAVSCVRRSSGRRPGCPSAASGRRARPLSGGWPWPSC